MQSPEGRGRARHQWREFRRSLPEDVRSAAFDQGGVPVSAFPEEYRPQLEQLLADELKAVRERSELIGFWVTWHLAGGFENLEDAGWHRATIFRKIKRFRQEYGAHPDEYEFSWLKLDLHRYWMDELMALLEIEPGRKE
jgi:hypothetical protein